MEKALKKYKKKELIKLIMNYEEIQNRMKLKLVKSNNNLMEKSKEIKNLQDKICEDAPSFEDIEATQEDFICKKYGSRYKSMLKTVDYLNKKIDISIGDDKLIYKKELDNILS